MSVAVLACSVPLGSRVPAADMHEPGVMASAVARARLVNLVCGSTLIDVGDPVELSTATVWPLTELTLPATDLSLLLCGHKSFVGALTAILRAGAGGAPVPGAGGTPVAGAG